MGDTIRLVSPDGRAIEVPTDQAGIAIDQGYHAESDTERTQRISDAAREETYGGVGGTAAAFGARALGTATLGLSDAAISALGGEEDLQALREVNPTASTLGAVAGAVVPLIPGLGLSKLPGGLASSAAAKIAGLGEGAGLAARAGYNAAGAALEGGLQNAGAYISDVALGDRDLSAEGFAGAMGHGAFWGGAAGGARTLAAGGLTAARRLFPKTEMTAANVAKVEREATEQIGRAVQDSDTLESSAREALAEKVAIRRAQDPEFAANLEAIKAAKLRESAARAETASAKASIAEEKAWAAKQQAAEVRDAGGKVVRKTRRAMGAAEEAAPATEAAATTAAAPEAATDSAVTALERQLKGTKEAIDAGKTLAQIGASKPAVPPIGLDDLAARELAKVDPTAAKLVNAIDELKQSRSVIDEWTAKYPKGAVDKFERNAGARDWAAQVKPKESGWYTSVPDQGTNTGSAAGGYMGGKEGNAFIRRGKQVTFRGTDEERAAAEAAITAKVSPEERAAAEAAVARSAARRKGIPEEVVQTPEEAISAHLQEKVPSIADDVARHAPALSRFEAASADLTETLGPRAPVSAQDHAAAFREAQQAASTKTEAAAINGAQDIDKAVGVINLPPLPGAAQVAGGKLAGIAQDAGTAWQALHMMGVPLPDPHDIPVVGPLLSMYLKARVLGKAFGRFGGKVAETAETAIAARAAATKQRIYTAVDAMLGGASKAMAKAAPMSGGVAAILAHKLFDESPPTGKPYTPAKPGADLSELYQARADELSAAMRPGAIRDAVRARVRTSDPTIVDAIVATKEREAQYLSANLPRPEQPPALLDRSKWCPSRPDLATFARRVSACADPAAVLERAAAGHMVTIEEVDAVKNVYPLLYGEAQRRLVLAASQHDEPIPFQRRLQLSTLFGLPMDASSDPSYASFLQQGYKAQATPPQPAGPAAPPTPTISADVRSSDRTDPLARR